MRFRFPLLLPFLLYGVCSAHASTTLSHAELIQALQQGGYVIFIRHPQTDPNQADTDTLHLNNWRAQRQLTPQGRAQATALGNAFRALHIPVGMVLTSRFKRAMDAAKLAGFRQARASLDITEPENVPPKEAQRRAAVLRTLLSTAPAAHTNTVLISHRPNLQDAAGKEFGDLAEREAAIFQPLGKEGYKLVARVAPTNWTEWTKTSAKQRPHATNRAGRRQAICRLYSCLAIL
ncbi:MAG TPA: histidine phosphatase family protein [Chthonomonadaceae bacterium]|nr:histidine phosphatase family protein [Chthonomonadaceae bacterium]